MNERTLVSENMYDDVTDSVENESRRKLRKNERLLSQPFMTNSIGENTQSRIKTLKLMDKKGMCFNNRNEQIMRAYSSDKLNATHQFNSSGLQKTKSSQMKNMNYMNTVRLFKTAN